MLVPKGLACVLSAYARKSVCRPAAHVFGVIQNGFKMGHTCPDLGKTIDGSGVEMCWFRSNEFNSSNPGGEYLVQNQRCTRLKR